MAHRPPTVALFSWAFFAVLIPLGFVLGMWLALLGHAVPVAFAALLILGLVQLTEEQRHRVATRIRTALQNSGLGFCQASRIMEYTSHSDFERALSGDRKLDEWRLEMLPVEFHREYAVLLLTDVGLPERISKFLEMVPALSFIQSDKRSA